MDTTPHQISLLGINVLPVPINEVTRIILQQIEQYRIDLRPRYISTINVNFVTNVHSCFSNYPRLPSLMKALQESSLATIDGFPLILLAKFLGSSKNHRVTGADLFPYLVKELSKKNGPIFLLGGDARTLKICMICLQSEIPTVKIVGASHPDIHVDGIDLVNFEDHDDLIIEQINKASPDILFLNLGNPKQELWFQRVMDKLHVPITIGIGGAFDLYAGLKKRAPVWVQKIGFEWLYRFIQEPKRLGKRYLADLVKFPLIAVPLILGHNLNKWIVKVLYRKSNLMRPPLLFIAQHHNLAIVSLPTYVDSKIAEDVRSLFEDLFTKDGIIIDFKNTHHLDLEGYALLINLYKRAEAERKNLILLNVNWNLRVLFRLHRVWGTLYPFIYRNTNVLIEKLLSDPKASSLYNTIQQYRHWVILSFLGKLDHEQDYSTYLTKIGPMIHRKDCVIDLSYVSYIDNSGIGFFLKLLSLVPEHINSLKLYNVNTEMKRQLKQAKVFDLFDIMDDLDSTFS